MRDASALLAWWAWVLARTNALQPDHVIVSFHETSFYFKFCVE